MLALLLLSGTACLSLFRVHPRINDDETPVSSAKLQDHVAAIAAEPHPVGSDANRRVRDYVLGELSALGLEPAVQVGTISAARGRDVTVENIVCRIPATEWGGADQPAAALLACHYDSHSRAPGAGDDASGVASLLETTRLLLRQRSRQRDLVLLFTDGEEAGLLGARVWVRDNPDLMGCRVVANFEARGTSGPALMFETAGSPEGLFQSAYARSMQPVTSSIAASVYENMPNGTDFSVFRLAGMAGLNFAFIDGYVNYHTRRDDPPHLSDASLLHQAAQAYAVAVYMATAPEEEFARNRSDVPFNRVYFDIASVRVVHYPAAWGWPLAATATALAALAVCRLRPRLRLLAGSIGRHALSLVVVVAWVHLVTRVPFPHSAHRWTPLAFAAAAALVGAGLPFVARAGNRHDRAAIAALLCLLVIGTWLTTVFFRPGSYAFAWPTLFVGLAACARRRRLRTLALAVAAVLSTLILLPLAWLVAVALTIRMLAAGAAVLALIAWLWRPALAPLLRRRWTITCACGALAALSFARVLLV